MSYRTLLFENGGYADPLVIKGREVAVAGIRPSGVWIATSLAVTPKLRKPKAMTRPRVGEKQQEVIVPTTFESAQMG